MALISAVVPSLGSSPDLGDCLRALRREGGSDLEILLVWQGEAPGEPPPEADRVLRTAKNLGFAAATNLGIANAGGTYIATVNDDAIVEPGWLAALAAALDGDSAIAAAQGINLILDRPHLIDGRGIAWNQRWQAVQIDHGRGENAVELPREPEEIFGVSATAALFRAGALGEEPFDPRLGSYYEDVDLAGRLRATGHRAVLVPAARALHAGSITGRRLGAERIRLIRGNRYLVLARLLGGAFWPRLPRFVATDKLDLLAAVFRGRGREAAGIVQGWGRAARRLSAFARRGEPAPALSEFSRFQVSS